MSGLAGWGSKWLGMTIHKLGAAATESSPSSQASQQLQAESYACGQGSLPGLGTSFRDVGTKFERSSDTPSLYMPSSLQLQLQLPPEVPSTKLPGRIQRRPTL